MRGWAARFVGSLAEGWLTHRRLLDLRAANLDVLGSGAAELNHRADPADHLLDRRRHEVRVTAELLELGGILDQREQAAGRGVPRRLVPGDDEEDVVGEQLPLR